MINFFTHAFAGLMLSVQALFGNHTAVVATSTPVSTAAVHSQAQVQPQLPAIVPAKSASPPAQESTGVTTQTTATIETQSTPQSVAVPTPARAVAPAVTTATVASTTPPAGAYINVPYHFWVQFPEGWANNGTGSVYPSITYVSPDKLASIRIWIGDPYSAGTPIQTLQATAAGKLTQLEKDLPTFTPLIDSSALTADGQPAWAIAGIYTDTNGQEESLLVYTVYHDGRVFELTGQSFSSTFMAFSGDIAVAIHSLTFTD